MCTPITPFLQLQPTAPPQERAHTGSTLAESINRPPEQDSSFLRQYATRPRLSYPLYQCQLKLIADLRLRVAQLLSFVTNHISAASIDPSFSPSPVRVVLYRLLCRPSCRPSSS